MPAAGIDYNRVHRHTVDDAAYLQITFLGIQLKVVAAAEIYLDVIEAPVVEICLGVLNLMSPEAGSHAVGILVVAAAAGVVAGIAVDSRLQAQRVDMVRHLTKPAGKADGVRSHVAICVAEAEVAVIYIDVFIARRRQAGRHQQICLLHDEGIRNIDHEGVPAGPAHHGWLNGNTRLGAGNCQHGSKNKGSPAHIIEV